MRQLAGGGCLARALQAGHQDYGGRLRGKFEARGVASERLHQLVAHDLDDLLGGRERSHHFLAERLLANVVNQFFDDFEVDIGFQQRQPNFAQRLLDVLFRQAALATQVLEGALQFFCEVLKHRICCV